MALGLLSGQYHGDAPFWLSQHFWGSFKRHGPPRCCNWHLSPYSLLHSLILWETQDHGTMTQIHPNLHTNSWLLWTFTEHTQDTATTLCHMSQFWVFMQKHTSKTLTENQLRWGPCLYHITEACDLVITILYVLQLFIQSPQQTSGNHNYWLTPWCFRKLNLNLTIVRQHLAP